MKSILAFILLFPIGLAAQTIAGGGGWRVVGIGHPAESKTNSTAALQDYTTIYTARGSYLEENKVLRLTLVYQFTTGTSSVTAIHGLKVGGTTVAATTAQNYTDGQTRSTSLTYIIQGTAAAGAAVAVEIGLGATLGVNANSLNTVTQPVTLATNGALAITPSITYSGTGSTETCVLRTYMVEELN